MPLQFSKAARYLLSTLQIPAHRSLDRAGKWSSWLACGSDLFNLRDMDRTVVAVPPLKSWYIDDEVRKSRIRNASSKQ
ncbi:hypothetical protein FRC02_001252 [Tulasnella sp. 418]|nr:hypothetical protein FRC02_001252 [Tulasnella sp. 418]